MSLSYQQMFEQTKGVISLLPTHFNRDESLDLGAMRETAEYACQQLKGHDGGDYDRREHHGILCDDG